MSTEKQWLSDREAINLLIKIAEGNKGILAQARDIYKISRKNYSLLLSASRINEEYSRVKVDPYPITQQSFSALIKRMQDNKELELAGRAKWVFNLTKSQSETLNSFYKKTLL